jgi:hypothetical protein
MKKLLLTLALATSLFAGNAQTAFSENFDGTTGTGLPAGWSQKNIDGLTLDPNNTIAMGNNAWISRVSATGSTDRVMTSTSWYTVTTANANDWLVTPQINIPTSGYWLVFEAQAPDASYLDGFSVKVSTTDTLPNSFGTVLNVPAATATYQEYAINLSAYAGQNVYITIINNSLDKNLLNINNFIVKKLPAFDLGVLSITNPAYQGPTSTNITGTIKNSGSTTITSFTANYKINGGAAVSAPITGVSIAPFTEYTFTHPTAWTPTAGSYTVTAYATLLNGSNVDGNTVNDIASKTINVMSKTIARTPLLEVFTSSTCPPCKPGNEVLHAVIDPLTGADKPCTIKFQQDFPGTGDPYCTTEAVNRRNYYAVNSIPRMEIDGGWDKNAASFTTAILNAAKANAAQYELTGSYWLQGPTVHGKVTYTPAFNAPAGTKLYVAIIENKTIKNVKNNGETQFEQVMKKMLPSETGTTLPAQANGVAATTNFDYTFQGNYRLSTNGQTANRIVHSTEHSVEEFSDLAMVAWLQGADKTVFQALNLTATPTAVGNFSANINAVNIYPNPSNTEVNIAFTSAKTENTTILMMSTDGKIVYSSKKDMQAGDNKVTINTADLANGIYNIAIIDAANNSKTVQVVVAH